MKRFMDKNFLLETRTSQRLYKACENLPVIDYHCHLSPQEIAENKQYENLTEIWLGGDHYKWRAMRAYGVEERFITGGATPYQKFEKWAETIENLIGNPLYHWTHLELQRYFGITEPLTKKSAPQIWDKANAILQSGRLTVKDIFKKFNIYAVGTTDDPIDTLQYHQQIASGKAPIGKIKTKVIPSFRPDNALYIEKKSFPSYIKSLAKVSGIKIKNAEDVVKALEKRLDFFVENGCASADHGMAMPPFEPSPKRSVNAVFKKAMEGTKLTAKDIAVYQTYVYVELGKMYAKRNIVMQYHMNVIRDTNSAMFKTLGANTGFDAAHDLPMTQNLAGLLNLMEQEAALPKTILYTLNPKDYYSLATVMGCFQNANNGEQKNVRGKIQLGSAWWFCDHKDGMEEQLRVLASEGMLSAFVGMLTDSRSFLSYPRHEYFRRIMCNLIGSWVENGEYPQDWQSLEKIVTNISFGNAKEYFAL